MGASWGLHVMRKAQTGDRILVSSVSIQELPTESISDILGTGLEILTFGFFLWPLRLFSLSRAAAFQGIESRTAG
ncbi:MAG: hypothetical protein CL912_07500 [Deltaproteobacteria bacterium]|nr:hypothetical protein [Deltaproteobacteria bacterium]